jgi:hypothetical protein
MKKIFYLIVLISILSSSTLVSADVFNTASGVVYTDIAYLQATFVNQNPSLADPGGYVDLLFKVENRGTKKAQNSTLEILPQYPFSLDPGVSAVNSLGVINGLQSGDNAFLVRYKLKVDKDAVDGTNEIKLKYSEGDGTAYKIATFNVSISNPRTDFDVIFQGSSTTSTSTGTSTSSETSTSSTTLAIANIGANTAQSVIVRIPQQVYFMVIGTSASIIGNLNGGDYTPVNFQIIPTDNSNTSTSREKNLTVEISYTDTLGIRRTIQKSIPLNLGTAAGTAGRFTQRSQQSSLSNSVLYIGIGVAGIVVIIVIIKIRTRKKK